MDTFLQKILILDIQVGESRFFLHRNKNFDLIFTHWSTRRGIRMARVNIWGFNLYRGLFISLTWSEEENNLYVGEQGGLNLKFNKAEQRERIIRMGINGELYKVGDEGVDVAWYHIREDSCDFLIPTAKEIWEFKIKRINTIIEGCKSKNFLFESTLVLQCLVMLVTGFEAFTQKRFIKIEREGNIPNIKSLMNDFARDKYTKEKVKDYAESTGKSLLESMLELRNGRGLINFQNWRDCKRAYNRAYGIIFGELFPLESKIFENIKKYFEWRHKIIHSKVDMTILNFDKVPEEEPIFAKKEFIEQVRDDYIKLINKLHEYTVQK